MNYIAIKDLKNTRSLREKLEKERELILTKDGQPFALLIGITPEGLEDSLREVRRAMFSKAVTSARKRAVVSKVSDHEIEKAVNESRKDRGLK